MAREKWDEANTIHDPEESMDISADFEDRTVRNILPDWTRVPLSGGAGNFTARLTTRTEVGA